MKNKIFIIEDHDEALKAWRERKLRNLDLVHVDAHIDFGFHPARPLERIVSEAKSLKELKNSLEYSLAFRHYEKDFDKQTDIGNYIYPAMQEGIVKDFYWIIPGGLNEFKKSLKSIKLMLKGFQRNSGCLTQGSSMESEGGRITAELLGRKFIICILEKLPKVEGKILLDIDTDFLVVDSLENAKNTKDIGKRKPWIFPQGLVAALKEKIGQPEAITIAYSVNGGYTPIKYRYLGDEIAYYFSPADFKERLLRSHRAAKYFASFAFSGEREFYWKAARLIPAYRSANNNYGQLYSTLQKFPQAEKEFLKILKADPENPACLLGLGDIALRKKNFKRAKRYLLPAQTMKNTTLFSKEKKAVLLCLAQAEFSLKNFEQAKELLIRYLAHNRLQPQSYYLLGRIYEKEKNFLQAASFYKDAIRLGGFDIDLLLRCLKISFYLKEKPDKIRFITLRLNEAKKRLLKSKKFFLKKGRIKDFRLAERKISAIEKLLLNKEVRDAGYKNFA